MPPSANRRFKNKYKKVKMAKKPLVNLIKQVAVKQANALIESKYVANSINNIIFNSAITAGSELYSLYPKLAQAAPANTWERNGIDVTPMRVKNTWIVSLAPVNRSVNVIVDLWLLIDKNFRYYPDVVAAGKPNFLRCGNSSGVGAVQGYNGYNTDGFRMINKERYTLLKHFRFQLASNVGNANGSTLTGNAPNVANQSVKTIEYVVDTPKQLRYGTDDPAVGREYPNGHAPFWCLGYSMVDGTPPDVLNQSITVSHLTDMIFKDA